MDLSSFFKKNTVFLDAYKRWLSPSFFVFLGCLVLLVYFQSSPKADGYVEAERLFTKWKASPDDPHLFYQMNKSLKEFPYLERKCQTIITQTLIDAGKGSEAFGIAQKGILEARSEIPFHSSFSETSFLIERGSYQKALEEAVALKERMKQEGYLERFFEDRLVGGALVYAHNLLRIACLQQELKNNHGEKAAWDEMEFFLERTKNKPVAGLLLHNFQEKGVDLFQYIQERRKILS